MGMLLNRLIGEFGGEMDAFDLSGAFDRPHHAQLRAEIDEAGVRIGVEQPVVDLVRNCAHQADCFCF